MSWISKNYEKATLGGAAVVAVGLIFLGWSKYGDVDTDFSKVLRGPGKNINPAVAGAELIPKAMQSMTGDPTWNRATDGDREVDLFTGITLFVKRSDPNKAVDLVDDPAVHEGIPNTWWLEYNIDPGFADSPDRDPDGDGFSNREEHDAKTDPSDDKSVPALIAKLMYNKDESLTWVLRPGYGSEGKFPFTYQDSNRQKNKVKPHEMVGPNELFFAKGVMAKRFKFLGSEDRKEMNEKVNIEMTTTWVRIEDQRPNKVGTIYEIPSPLSEARAKEFLHYDRTAVLSLEALGQSGIEFQVEENTAFALPQDAPKKDYIVKKVTPESVTIEYPAANGERKTVEISKGTLPNLSE